MKIAIPIAQNRVCMHFGHCEFFGFYEVDLKEKKIVKSEMIAPPPHQPGILPPWIKSQGGDLVIAGGMGSRAQNLFRAAGVQVLTGAPSGNPEEIIINYLNNTLETGENACDH